MCARTNTLPDFRHFIRIHKSVHPTSNATHSPVHALLASVVSVNCRHLQKEFGRQLRKYYRFWHEISALVRLLFIRCLACASEHTSSCRLHLCCRHRFACRKCASSPCSSHCLMKTLLGSSLTITTYLSRLCRFLLISTLLISQASVKATINTATPAKTMNAIVCMD